MKKAPLLCSVLIGSVLLTVIAALGWDTIYAEQDKDLLKRPLLSVVFTGINDGIYPWQLFGGKEVQETVGNGNEIAERNEQTEYDQELSSQEASEETGQSVTVTPSTALSSPLPTRSPSPSSMPSPSPEVLKERPEPMRESTYEEYINHISADIYGDVGVQYAATYEFVPVEESYFDDVLFIGDSRTVGLRDYTDLSEHADFMCETSLTIYKVMEERFKGMGTVEEVLKAKNYGKIYLMVGINELGRGTTEDFMAKYTEVVDQLHELAPEAKIVIQANMHVSEKKSSSDEIFNNQNIRARNHAIATLADNETFFYVDMNEAVCDENGDLKEEYTHDQIHLLGMYNELWKEFLLAHGLQ